MHRCCWFTALWGHEQKPASHWIIGELFSLFAVCCLNSEGKYIFGDIHGNNRETILRMVCMNRIVSSLSGSCEAFVFFFGWIGRDWEGGSRIMYDMIMPSSSVRLCS